MGEIERCEQCGGTDWYLSYDDEYGWLCALCSARQAERDEARDRFEHLSPSSLGFRWEDE